MKVRTVRGNQVLFVTLLCAAVLSGVYVLHQIPQVKTSMITEKQEFRWRMNSAHRQLLLWFNASAVTDRQTMTSWGAPIIWEGTFSPQERDEFHQKKKTVIGLTVFAIGRYLDRYLRTFLESAEKHFMTGHQVIFYVLVDNATKVPPLATAAGRRVTVLQVPRFSRWQDISMMRMQLIADLIQEVAHYQVTYLFCFDVDQKFMGRFGAEALGDSVAQIHAAFYRAPKIRFTYERRPKSAAYIAPHDGDFYYHAAVFGGTVDSVARITTACLEGIIKDKSRGVEAVWHDESHLNRYFLEHKPSILLSPEYCWDRWPAKHIKYVRLVWMPKDYKNLRQNRKGNLHPASQPIKEGLEHNAKDPLSLTQ